MGIDSVSDPMRESSVTSRVAVLMSDRLMFRKSFAKMLQVLEPDIVIEEQSSELTPSIILPAEASGLVVVDAGSRSALAVEDLLLTVLSIQPEACIILVLDEQDDTVINAAMDAGALGVAIKAAPPQVLIDMLQRGLNAERFRPAPVVTVAREDIPAEMRRQLSARQQKLLRLMIGGQSISMTASKLGITPAKVVTEMRTVLGIVRGRLF